MTNVDILLTTNELPVTQYPDMPLHYIAHLYDFLREQGVDANTWLSSAGLTEQQVRADIQLISFATYQKLLTQAVALYGTDIGLRVGARLSVNSHGALGFALNNCRHLEEALSLVQRFVTTRNPLISVTVERAAQRRRICIHEAFDLGALRAMLYEVLIATFTNILRDLGCAPEHLLSIEFCHAAPVYAEAYKMFGCPVTFSHRNCVVEIDERAFSTPVVAADHQALLLATAMCEADLDRVKALQKRSDKIRSLLMSLDAPYPGLEQIAAQLNVSARTLHRQLCGENTQYSTLLEEVRCAKAQHWLTSSLMPIKEIAYLLGYTDVANFRRAFKRWQGISPQQYRMVNLST